MNFHLMSPSRLIFSVEGEQEKKSRVSDGDYNRLYRQRLYVYGFGNHPQSWEIMGQIAIRSLNQLKIIYGLYTSKSMTLPPQDIPFVPPQSKTLLDHFN